MSVCPFWPGTGSLGAEVFFKSFVSKLLQVEHVVVHVVVLVVVIYLIN